MKIAGIIAGAVALLVLGTWAYFALMANPRIARELVNDPDGARAQKVMLLGLPSGRELPVNYLHDEEDGLAYAGADGRWWRELRGEGAPVEVLIRGQRYTGVGRAVEDDPDYTKRIFERLRPTALPGFGTLVEIRLSGEL